MIIICVKKRRSKKEKVNEDVELFVSMRHRLREDSTQNPLMDALAKMDPEDEPPNCRLDNVEYVKDLGQGQFGKVFQGKIAVTFFFEVC